jgi:predicted RNase H-like nuclease
VGPVRVLGIDLAAQPENTGTAAPWLAVDAAALRRRDHDLDALICALVGRAAATGRTRRPAEDQRDRARREGWIHVPTVGLDALVRGAAQSTSAE